MLKKHRQWPYCINLNNFLNNRGAVNEIGCTKLEKLATAEDFGDVGNDLTTSSKPNSFFQAACSIEKCDVALCPQMCGATVPLKDLKRHLLFDCQERIVTCPYVGCGKLIQLSHLDFHQKNECEYIKRRNGLVYMKENRKIEEKCIQVPQSSIQKSNAEYILYRNKLAFSYRERMRMKTENESMKINDLWEQESHLKEETSLLPDDPFRDKLASSARSKLTMSFYCPDCGEEVPMTSKLKHKHECPNRKVPCKFAEYGCSHIVRLRDRWKHERVDGIVGPRSALHFTGKCGYVDIGVNDHDKGSWTAEFWVLRSNEVDAVYLLFEKVLNNLIVVQRHECNLLNVENNLIIMKQKMEELAKKLSRDRSDELLENQTLAANKIICLNEERKQTLERLLKAMLLYHILLNETDRLLKQISHSGNLDELWIIFEQKKFIPRFLENNECEKFQADLKLLRNGSDVQYFVSTLVQDFSLKESKIRGHVKDTQRRKSKGKRRSAKKFDSVHTEAPRSHQVGGYDILASSENFSLYLCGRGGRIGFSVAQIGDYEVDFVVSRNKWVHVAYVCTSETTSIFVDSVLVGKVNQHCGLPLQMIGNDRNAIHGILHDVRYWNYARSPNEIRTWMNQSLKLDCIGDNLIGWWTFEEGQGVYVFDVSDRTKYQSKVFGKGTMWTNDLKTGLQPPIPSSREHRVCKVGLFRTRLAHLGRQKFQLIPCTTCGIPVSRKSMKFHSKYYCTHSSNLSLVNQTQKGKLNQLPLQCSIGCGAIIERNCFDRHVRSECSHRLITCGRPNCSHLFPIYARAFHDQIFH